jgi:hypothetical protein
MLENDFSRNIIGFDAFGKFPKSNSDLPSDSAFITEFELQGGFGLSSTELNSFLSSKAFRNIDLVEGNILETLEVYLQKHNHTRIALLHLDLDVFVPTDYALDLLYERIVPGGLIIFDNFNFEEGATLAIEKFCKEKSLQLLKAQYYAAPSYVVKV